MSRILRTFVQANVSLSRRFESLMAYPPSSAGSVGPQEVKAMFIDGKIIADVGGGKKPYAASLGLSTDEKIYIGIDLDSDELASAPIGVYAETRTMDICAPASDLYKRFDLIICRNTLEHVKDTEAAIEGLSLMLAPNGLCYVKVPCKRAIFAQLNLLLPNEIKRLMMHAIFPHKAGDGFPAFYNLCLPSSLNRLVQKRGLEMIAERRTYRSSYFGFFFPIYLLWRLMMTIQYIVDPDYCENFEVVFRKPGEQEGV